MPDPVVRRPADRQPRQPRDGLPDPGDPVEVADGVLRQPAAPALHLGVDRGAVSPVASARSAQRDGDELVVGRLERGLLAVPAEGGPQEQHVAPSARAGRADPRPLRERERRRLDRRPSTGGTRKPELARPRVGHQSSARKARVTTAMEA